MANSGIQHVVSAVPVSKSQYEDQAHHALIHGTSFPASPVERQLFYRDDLHTWYIYNGSSWVETTSQGVTVHNDLTGRDDAGCHPFSAISSKVLNGLDDVSVAAPTDGYFVYRDGATGLWKCKAHADLTTGVHGISIPLFSAETKTYYIDYVNGDDGNGGESTGDAFKTWDKAETMIPIFVRHTYTIRVIGNLPQTILLANRMCHESLIIIGHTEVAAAHQVNEIDIRQCHGLLKVTKLRSAGIVYARSSSIAADVAHGFQGIEPRYPDPGSGFRVALASFGSIVYVRDCDFGTDVVGDCIYASGSRLVSRNNTGNGLNYGLTARDGATIGKKDSQPTGTVGNELEADGGVIR